MASVIGGDVLYSFLIETDPLPSNAPVYVRDSSHDYTFLARAGHSQHFYTNIVIDEPPRVQFAQRHKFRQLAAGGAVYFTPTQAKLNEGLARDQNVIYRVSTRGHPRRAIVTFPALL